jgi:plasmid stabilization system protein ParE
MVIEELRASNFRLSDSAQRELHLLIRQTLNSQSAHQQAATVVAAIRQVAGDPGGTPDRRTIRGSFFDRLKEWLLGN